MVLETWATDLSIGDHQKMFIAHDNPVQRRPKFDYFSNEAVNNMIPIVSHISSNGYYGYCAMPMSSRADNDTVHQPVDDDKIQMDIQMNLPSSEHQTVVTNTVERRKRCQTFMHDDQLIAMKRCRNHAIDAEIGEGLSMHYLYTYAYAVLKWYETKR